MRLRPAKSVFVFLFAAAMFFCAESHAQSTNATVTGQITDQSGRLVPGAAVVFTNINTGVPYSTQTNGEGIYSLPTLQPGIYRANITKDGFKSIVKPDVELHVQDQVSINFALQVGSVSETVTVEGGTPLLNTTDASVGTTIDRNFAENIPMNGRSFQTLIELTPGVVVAQSNSSDNGQFSINGQRATSNYWTVDGVSANIGISAVGGGNGVGGTLGSFSAFGGTNSLVSVDALEEFRVQTSSYAPEFGRTPGGQISIVTRSGTNELHGSIFDYLRNYVLDANDWFNGQVAPPLPKPKERQNDFGGTAGGPIVRDRTFFFFSYEGLRLALPQTALTHVPDTSPSDPNSRQFATPAMQPYLNAYPLPNGPAVASIPGAAEFNASFTNPATLDAYSLRVDHKATGRLTFFGRYSYSPSEIDQRGSGGGSALSDVGVSHVVTQTATVGATWAISPTFSDEFRFNYSRTAASNSNYLDDFGGAVPLASLPLPQPFSEKDARFQLQVRNLGSGRNLLDGNAGRAVQRQINVTDNFSNQRGSHSLKFGLDFRRLSPSVNPPLYTQGAFFANVPNANLGNSLFGFVFSTTDVTVLFRELSLFAQDSWRVTPRLTVTYGLRWDVDFAPHSIQGPAIAAVTSYSLTDFSTLGIARAGTPPFGTAYNNVAPRLGIAYQTSVNQNWGSVFRAGFGVFYDLLSSESGNLIAYGFPPFEANNFDLSGPFPYTAQQAAPVLIPSTGQIPTLYAFNPNLKTPYTLQWNVALEQSMGKDQSLTASYVGAAGRRLLQPYEISAPPSNPNLFGIFVDSTAVSSYNALQLQFQRRLVSGLQALVSYTWSHSIDDGSTGSTNLVSNNGVPSDPSANRGPSDFDIRNTLTAAVTYEFPAPKDAVLGKALLGGWSTDSVVIARTAPPVDIIDGNYSSCSLALGIAAAVRPDFVAGQRPYLYGSQFPGDKAINPSAFTDPPVDPLTGCPQRQGTVPRNFARGFGATEWDLAIHRDFPIRESVKLQFRAEMFNVLNHPNFGPPSNTFGIPGFGESTQMLAQSLNASNVSSGGLNPLYQIGGPRSIQFALKLFF